MHKFLRAIGFSNIRKKDLDIILEEIIEHPDVMRVTKDSIGNEFSEILKFYGDNMGIMVRGSYDENDVFQINYYLPFSYYDGVSTQEQIDIEKHAEKEMTIVEEKQMETIIKVNGMMCPHCKARVESVCKAVEGAADAVVDLQLKQVTVTGNASVDALKKAITDAGYEVVG
mgnify:CR=1 FL=1